MIRVVGYSKAFSLPGIWVVTIFQYSLTRGITGELPVCNREDVVLLWEHEE